MDGEFTFLLRESAHTIAVKSYNLLCKEVVLEVD